jgi:hypothetical protein
MPRPWRGFRKPVPQVSKPAVSRVSKPAGLRQSNAPGTAMPSRFGNRRYSRLGSLRYGITPDATTSMQGAGHVHRTAGFQTCCIAGFQTRRPPLIQCARHCHAQPIWKSAVQQTWQSAVRDNARRYNQYAGCRTRAPYRRFPNLLYRGFPNPQASANPTRPALPCPADLEIGGTAGLAACGTG